MTTRRFDHFTPALVAAATLLGMIAVPALAAGSTAATLNDGRLHGFDGCLTQEPSGVRYFDLAKAKADDGASLGTVRLTSSVWGITPKEAVNHEVHINGMYRGRMADDPQGGHIAVKDAVVIGNSCS